MVGHGEGRSREVVGRGIGEGHGRRPAGGRRRRRRRAVGEEGCPVDRRPPVPVETELGVEGYAPGVGRSSGADAGREAGQVQSVSGGTHRVRRAGGPEPGRWRGARVEEGRLHLVGTGLLVGRRDGQGDAGQDSGRGGKREGGRCRHRLGVQRGAVLHRVGQLQVGGMRRPPRIEVGAHHRDGPGGEVVARRRRRQAGTPPEAVGRHMDCAEIGLEGGERDGRDVVRSAVEGRAPLVVDGGADQVEVAAADVQVSVEFSGALEVALGARALDGVERVGRVDRPIRSLHGLRRVVELGPRPGVEVLPLGVGGAEGGEDRGTGGIQGFHVAVARKEEVPVRLLGDVVEVVDQRVGAADRSGGRIEQGAARRVLDHADNQLERRPRAHSEQTGRIARLGVDRPEQGARR